MIALLLGCSPRSDEVVVRMEVRTEDDLAALDALGADVWSEHVEDSVLARIRRADLARLPRPAEVVIDDLPAALALAAPSGVQGDFFADWRPFDEIDAQLDVIAAQVPWAKVVDVGTSLEGRPIRALSLAVPRAAPDDRLGVLVTATQHAREWVAASSALYLAQHLVDGYGADPAVTELLDQHRIWIVPVANPDGYEYTWSTDRLWRKNRADNGDGSFGVDLNRNWDAAWGGAGSSPVGSSGNYHGPAAFSEPETAALAAFAEDRPRIAYYLDLHCTGQLALRPWGFTATPAPDEGPLAAGSVAASDAMSAVWGASYDEGPFNTRLYPGSGVAVDWAYGIRGAWSWLFELRDKGQYGFLLPADQIGPTGDEVVAGFEALFTVPERPRLLLSANRDPIVAGQRVELAVWRAPAGARVRIFRSETGLGSTTVAGGDHLDLADPKLIAVQDADDSGAVFVHLVAPTSWSGRTVWLQAVAHDQPSIVVTAAIP